MAYSREIKAAFAEAKTFLELIHVNSDHYTNIGFEKAFEMIETRDEAMQLARHTYGNDYPHGCHHADCSSDCDLRVVRALKRYYQLPESEDFSETDSDAALIEFYVWSYEDLFKAKAQYHGFL